MSKKDDGKTVRVEVGIWLNDRTGQIHIAAKGQFISTVSADPKSKRYHPNLYRKLTATLRDAGKPHPNPSPEGEGPEE